MKNILIIDDEESIRFLIKDILGSDPDLMDSNFFEADNGNQATKIVDGIIPDLIITDIIMPEKEGISIILEIKKKYPHIKIIAISGGGINSPGNYLSLAKQLGADKIFQKPFRKNEFTTAVKELLN